MNQDLTGTTAERNFILQQGLLPLDLLQQAVLDDFVPARLKGS